MAVFPTARRALSRPSRLPWLIAATVLVAATFSVPTYTLLDHALRDAPVPVSRVDTTSTDPQAKALSDIDEPGTSISPLTQAERELLAVSTASDVLLAADEAAFIIPRVAADVATENERVSEVSSVAVQAEETNEAPVATSEAPATQAQTAEVAPPAQPVAPTLAGPIERWAAAGILIETQGQELDDASLSNVDAALGALPASVLANLGNPAFGDLHILVNVAGRALSGDQPYGGPANFFSTNEATNELVLYPQQSVFTIVHELGHAYNLRGVGAGKYAMVLLDPEMRSFLDATGWTITSSDAEIRAAVDHMHVDYTYNGSFHWPRLSNDDPLEDFANSFATYFLDPATLQQSSPERYAWMAATFGQ